MKPDTFVLIFTLLCGIAGLSLPAHAAPQGIASKGTTMVYPLTSAGTRDYTRPAYQLDSNNKTIYPLTSAGVRDYTKPAYEIGSDNQVYPLRLDGTRDYIKPSAEISQ